MDQQWYALTVKPRYEFKVLEGIKSLGEAEGFVPSYQDKRRWSDRVKILDVPLFTGYVFAKFNVDSVRVPILRLGGVKSIVAVSGGATPIPEPEIANLRGLVSSGFALQEWPFLKKGQRVRVEHGPLRGVEGIVVSRKDEWMMVVSIDLLQRSVAVELDRTWLKAA